MKFALINPPWTFEGSIYFGCREPHLPLELGYARIFLESVGHDVLFIDAHLEKITLADLMARLQTFRPDYTVITTAPTYLFWRCPQPELRIPAQTISALKELDTVFVAVGPHGSTSPGMAIKKLGAQLLVLGEFEELLPQLGTAGPGDWQSVKSLAYVKEGELLMTGPSHSAAFSSFPALKWERRLIERHQHHHHRFDAVPAGPGAEVESSRGCPFSCTFCARDEFRGVYRRRSPCNILDEIDDLLSKGVKYLYFIDEIFLPFREFLQALIERNCRFGIQTRLDLWDAETLEMLGRAGCVSIEAGVESISEDGRRNLNKVSNVNGPDLRDRFLEARKHVPFVQATLLDSKDDSPGEVAAWRNSLLSAGIWVNDPVPLFPYPGSEEYRRRWGRPDDLAWDRAHDFYLRRNSHLSDLQDERPLPLRRLERRADHELR